MSIFSIFNHPCFFIVCYYLFGVFLSLLSIIFRVPSIEKKFCRMPKELKIPWLSSLTQKSGMAVWPSRDWEGPCLVPFSFRLSNPCWRFERKTDCQQSMAVSIDVTFRCDIKNIARTEYMYFYKNLTYWLSFHRHPHSSSASSALLHSAACGTLSGHSRCPEEVLLWTSFTLHQLRAWKGKTTRVLLCRRTGTGLRWIL